MPAKNSVEYLLSLPSGGLKAPFRRQLARRLPTTRDWAEFGVFKGASAKIWLPYVPANRRLFLFDSWQGLPTDWAHSPAGTFACKKPPKFRSQRVKVVPGWFHESLPPWVAQRRGQKLSFVHIDCDLYDSTLLVLRSLRKLLDAQTVILFDELYHDDRQREHEFRAFQDFVREAQIDFEYLERSDTNAQVAVRLLT
jgi:Methyltransferase domain